MSLHPLLKKLLRSPWLAIAVGVVVMLPTLGAGFLLDDVLMRMRLSGASSALGEAPWWALYTFADPDVNLALRDAGVHPWWSDPTVKMVFFRPLSAATHVLDFALWPDQPVLHHLHSLAWYALAVAAAGWVFRRLQPAIAPLATLLFAVAAPHAMILAWTSARNTLITFVIACGMVVLHTTGRRWAGVVALAVGLLAGEAVLGGLAYLVAWQCCMATGSLWRRLVVLVPHALVVVLWRVLYVAAGFGTAGTGIYFDPGDDLLGALFAVCTHLPVLLMSEWTLLPLDGWAILPPVAHTGLIGLGLLLVPVWGLLLWRRLRLDPATRFWALGMVLSIVPFTLTMPMDRLLIFSSLGLMPLLGGLILWPGPSRWSRWSAAALFVLHLPLSAPRAMVRGWTTPAGVDFARSGLSSDPANPEQTHVAVTGTFHRVHHTTFMRRVDGQPTARRTLVLSSCMTDTVVTRVDERTLDVHAPAGWLGLDLDRIHRADGATLPVGSRIALPDAELEVTESTADGRPSRARVRFAVPLDHPSLAWTSMDPGETFAFPPVTTTEPFVVPEVGESVSLPGILPW